MKTLKVIQTKRLILRPLQDNDAEEIFILRSNPELGKYIKRAPQKGIAEAYAFIKKIKNLVLNNSTYYWVIQLKNNPDCIGTICLWNISKDRKTAEIGYDLLLDFHGKGIMTEALVSVLKYGFDKLNFNLIEAFTHKDNQASINLLQSNRFVLTNKKDPGFPENINFVRTK